MYITPTGGVRNPFYTVTQFSVVESFWTLDLKYFWVQNRDPISLNAFKLINNLLIIAFFQGVVRVCVCVSVCLPTGGWITCVSTCWMLTLQLKKTPASASWVCHKIIMCWKNRRPPTVIIPTTKEGVYLLFYRNEQSIKMHSNEKVYKL